MPAVSWRISGVTLFNQGDLELSGLHLYGWSGRLCAAATLTSSHEPIAGSLANLQQANGGGVCSFKSSDVSSPGFWIQWNFPVPVDVTYARLRAGLDPSRAASGLQIYALAGIWRAIRPANLTESYVFPSADAWYVDVAPIFQVRAATPEVIADSASQIEVAIPAASLAGDLLTLFVMHRSELFVPDGWVLRQTSPRATDLVGTQQWVSVLTKQQVVGSVGFVQVGQAAAGRLIAGCVAVDTHGLEPVVSVVSDAVSGEPYGSVTAMPIAVEVGGVGFLSVSIINYSAQGGGWVGPPEKEIIFGREGSAPRLMVAKTASPGISTGVFSPPGSASGGDITGRTMLSVSVAPSGVGVPATRPSPVQLSRSNWFIAKTGAVPFNGQGPMHRLACAQARDAEFGGQGSIYGVVELYAQAGNVPLSRRVRLHRSRDGLLVRETWSDAQGNYRFDGLTDRYTYDVIAWDHEGLQRSVVANDLTPEVLL